MALLIFIPIRKYEFFGKVKHNSYINENHFFKYALCSLKLFLTNMISNKKIIHCIKL